MKLDSIFLQLPDNMNNLKIWGVLYMSHVGQKILANFLHIFEQQKQTQILKIPLIESDEEKYSSKSNRMNVALKFFLDVFTSITAIVANDIFLKNVASTKAWLLLGRLNVANSIRRIKSIKIILLQPHCHSAPYFYVLKKLY